MLESSHQTSVWWDWLRRDCDATMTQFSQDAERISQRHNSIVKVEQRVYYFTDRTCTRGPKAVCEMMNNTWPSSPIVAITFDSGEIVEYTRTDEHRERELFRVPLDPPAGLDEEQALAYKEILHNPALYALCARSPNASAWITCANRSGWSRKKSVLLWVYRYIRHEGVKK